MNRIKLIDGFIIPIKFNDYYIVVANRRYEIKSKFKITNTRSKQSKSLDDGELNSKNNNNARHPAVVYCCSLTIDGLTNWYLPSLRELEFVFDYNHLLGDEFKLSNSEYLTSSECDRDQSAVWFAGPNKLQNQSYYKTIPYLVRPITKILED